MSKNRVYFSTLSIIILVLASCSSGKKGGQSYAGRVYHNTTSHYNGYYYAKLKMNEVEDQMEMAHKDDYTKLLPIYPIGNVDDPAAGGEMDSIIKRLTVVVKLHPKSKWADDCYYNIGKAYYYKKNYEAALATFQYVSSEFKDKSAASSSSTASSPTSSSHKKKKHHGKPMTKAEREKEKEKEEAKATAKSEKEKKPLFDFLKHKPVRNTDLLWMVRTYSNMKRYSDANAIIDFIEQDKQFPASMKGELALTKAYINIQQRLYDKAIDPMKTAVATIKDNKENTRYNYILAQLYQLSGDYQNATKEFTRVTKLHPSYEMDFNARISVAKNYIESGSGSAREILSKLDDMSHNDKYDQFYDQIYYYMALVNLRQNKDEDAIKDLESSIAASYANPNQKGLSFLKMGEISFSEQDYLTAQPSYDSAVVFLNAKFDTLDRVKEIQVVLDKISDQLRIVMTQDSLQKLARMTDKERNKVIDHALTVQQQQEQQAALDTARDLETAQVQNLPGNASSSGSWYFYNVSMKGSGYNDFVKKWGNRPLEDNWRRINKKSNDVDLAANETTEEEKGTAADSAAASGDASRKALLAGIPLTPQKLEESNKKIFAAYYTLGTLYKDELRNLPRAIETFEKLATRYPDNPSIPQVYYSLYLLYNETGNTARAEEYKQKIVQNFPTSSFAMVLSDPEYLTKTAAKENELNNYYASTYDYFVAENYSDVIRRVRSADSLFKPNPLQPKFDLLKAFVVGKTGDRSSFVAALDTVVAKYPSGEEHDKALEILTLLGERVNTSASKTMDAKVEDKNAKPAPYVLHPNNSQYLVVVFNTISPKTKAISDSLANFNSANHSLDNLKVTPQLLDTKTQMIVVKQMKGVAPIMDYYNEITGSETMFEQVEEIGYDIFVIDDKNFPIFYQRKNVAEYLDFFEKNYAGEEDTNEE